MSTKRNTRTNRRPVCRQTRSGRVTRAPKTPKRSEGFPWAGKCPCCGERGTVTLHGPWSDDDLRLFGRLTA